MIIYKSHDMSRIGRPRFRSAVSGRQTAGLAAALLVTGAAGCGSGVGTERAGTGGTRAATAGDVTCSSPSGASGAGTGTKAVGFIYVGATTDFGYNQAAHVGAEALGKACPKLKILEADEIPETADMTRVADQMIGQGAKVIYATSYGYKDFAVKVAKAHPDVAVLQQGNRIDKPVPANINTYFGNSYETMYLAGIAAGKSTKSNKLGVVAAFPVPPVMQNINAFQMGAQSVNPEVTTTSVFVGNWCNPGKQADAARSLLAGSIDVITQQQDCTGTIIKATEAAGAFSVGYDYDAHGLAPKGWLTGAAWNWAPLFGAMTSSVLKGDFASGPFKGNYTVGFAGNEVPSPMALASYGPSVSPGTKAQIAQAKARILGGRPIFTGPIVDQTGKVQVADGTSATPEQIATMGFFVKGVVGSIPK